MKIFTTFIFICCMATSGVQAQTKQDTIEGKPGLFFNFSSHGLKNTGINGINDLLEKRHLLTMSNALASSGFGIIAEFKKGFLSVEYMTFRNVGYNRASTENDFFTPHLSGYGIKGLLSRKLMDKKRWCIDAGLGLSFNKFHFTLVDKRPLAISFDSLLATPSAAPVDLDYVQQNYNSNLEAKLGITYRTHSFKKYFDAFNLSLNVGYSQPFSLPTQWSSKNIPLNVVKDFPKTTFANMYIQFGVSMYFKRKT